MSHDSDHLRTSFENDLELAREYAKDALHTARYVAERFGRGALHTGVWTEPYLHWREWTGLIARDEEQAPFIIRLVAY